MKLYINGGLTSLYVFIKSWLVVSTVLKNDGVRQWEYIYIYGWWYTYPSEK